MLNAYFKAVMEANADRWIAGRSAYICTNPGIRARLFLINEVLKFLEVSEGFDARLETEEKISKKLIAFVEPILHFVQTATDAQIQAKFSKKFGEGGVVSYYYNLCEILLPKHKTFGSKDFHDYRARQSDARNDQIRRDVLDIQEVVTNVGIQVLKKLYGTEETSSGEPAYRNAFKTRPCLVVADGFYEWQKIGPKEKQPYFITRRDGAPFAFAGLWEPKAIADRDTFTIITCPANEAVAPIHERMPVMLAPEDWDKWLAAPEDRKSLLKPFPAGQMDLWPVDKKIGNVRNTGSELVERSGSGV